MMEVELESIRANFDLKRDMMDSPEDEGEIMLFAMILLQLNGVKLPSSPLEEGSDSLNKKKRQRTSPEQLAILETIFQTDKMPNLQTRVHLADQLGMSSRRVQIWFQNKRAKVKRSSSKIEVSDEAIALSLLQRRDSTSSLSSSASSTPSSPLSPSVPSDDALPSPSSSPVLVPQLLNNSMSNSNMHNISHSFQLDALALNSAFSPFVVSNNISNVASSSLSCEAPSLHSRFPLASSW